MPLPAKSLTRIDRLVRELPARVLSPSAEPEGCRRCPGCAVAGTPAASRCGVPLKRLLREGD